MQNSFLKYTYFMGIQKNDKIIANFIQKMAKRKLPFNDFSIIKATAPFIVRFLLSHVFVELFSDYSN